MRIKPLLLLALCAIITLSSGSHAFAAYTKDDAFYDGNDILFYDPNFQSTCSGSDSNSGGIKTVSTLKKSPLLEKIFQDLLNAGMNTVQAAAVMGNMYHESGFNPDQHEIGNDIGYGLVQWSFERRTALEAYAHSKGVPPSDVDMQMDFLINEYNNTYKSKLAGSAFADGKVVKDATKAWMMIFEVPKMSPANDPAGLNSARIPAANTIYGFYSDLKPDTTSTTALQSECDTDNNAVAGDIVQTALNYAWPTPIDNKDNKVEMSDARPSYQTAKEKYSPGTNWSDCGAFVTTVMQSSGLDPNYPKEGVANQAAYVRAHPELYMIINNAKVSDLQPGDIIILNTLGHTAISQGANKPNIDASNNERVPSVRPAGSDLAMISNAGPPKGAFIARFIGTKQ